MKRDHARGLRAASRVMTVPDSFSSSFSRPTWAEIRLDALCANARLLRATVQTPLLCVIKANAYGHGAETVARALEPLQDDAGASLCRIFGVASVDEGMTLREAGVTRDILLLSAILPSEAANAARYDLMPTLYERDVAAAFSHAARELGKVGRAHFKIDTGMGRLGVSWRDAFNIWRELQALPNLRIEGVYTHFACADDEVDVKSDEQLRRFQSALCECGLENISLENAKKSRRTVMIHAANSAGALRYPNARFDLSRVGLALFGVRPGDELQASAELPLRPVMAWHSRITGVKTVPRGETVSYGGTWRAPRDSRIAIVPVGYADGYSRRLGNRAQVVVDGARVPVVGRVTMDQLLLDVTTVNAQVGTTVELWGNQLRVEEVATWADTIPYELLCGVGSRVPRITN